MAEKYYGTPPAQDPKPPAAWRPKVGPADEATRSRMLAEALKSKSPVKYSPTPMPIAGKGKVTPKSGLNLRVEKALKDAGA